MMTNMTSHLNRRTFLRASAAGAAFALTRRSARALDLGGKLRVASVGTGNKGADDLREISASPRVEVAAICDVDHSEPHLGWAATQFPKAERYADYRRLFEKPDLFDAVIVSTPDHMHAPIALAAMALGKHVFCQKPLTHTVDEARKMRTRAEERGVVTQMGNQIQSHRAYRTAVKLLEDGAIGKVREIHAWQAGDMGWLITDKQPDYADPIPDTLDWNLWLGVAPARQYIAELYHPVNWRAWQDFSNGQLGDFGCHILDPIFLGLGLTAPISIEAEAPELNDEVWAPRCKVSYRFPATPRTVGPVVPLTWYDGRQHKPKHSALGLPSDYRVPGAGSALVGEAGTIVIPHWDMPRLFPEEKFRDHKVPQLDDVNHYTSWVDASLGDGKTTSHFGYAGPLTEAVLLGAVAVRFAGQKHEWDAANGKFTNHQDANQRLAKSYRAGWM
jgi:predicted dehydrogenase